MGNPTLLAATISGAVAIVVLIAKYVYDIRLSARRARLERTNEQLRHFYGPMYARLILAGDLFYSFKEAHSPGSGFWQNLGDAPSPEQAGPWRHWIENVFSPINDSILQLVTDRADLIEEIEMPQCFLLLNQHVAGYRVLIERWRNGDFRRHLPEVMFPAEELHTYAATHLSRLKKQQAGLLNSDNVGPS